MPTSPKNIASELYELAIQNQWPVKIVLMGMKPELESVMGKVASKRGGEICISQEGGKRNVIIQEQAIMCVFVNTGNTGSLQDRLSLHGDSKQPAAQSTA